MATVFFDPNDVFTVSNNNTIVKGSTGAEVLTLAAGVLGLQGDQNIERIALTGDSSAFTFQQKGNTINVFSNGVLVCKTPVQGDANGTQLTFFNGTVDVKLVAGGVMTLGGTAISPTQPGSVTPATIDTTLVTPGGPPLDRVIDVNAAGSFDADAPVGHYLFTIGMGNYTYNIDNFDRGDVLDFPTGNTPSINNDNFQDGIVDVSFALTGQTVTIHLTGIPTSTDALLYSPEGFDAVFGAGTLA